MNKNNFDEFFREKFKEFGEAPDEKVWEAIESSLDKKRKKRGLLPIWWKIGGIAALLAVLFYIVKPFEDSSVPAVVNTATEQEERPTENQEVLPDNNAVSDADNTSDAVQQAEDPLVKTPSGLDKDTHTAGIASTNENSNVSPEKEDSEFNAPDVANINSTGQVVSNTKHVTDNVTEDANKQNIEEGLATADKEKTLISAVDKGQKNNIPNGINEEKNDEATVATEVAGTTEKKSIFDEIDQQEEVVANAEENKWSVGPSVAPVYFSSFGEGSPIHSNFVPNSKSGSLNLSYGLSVSYAVSKKLSVRSGVHKVDYGYDTNDVQFSSSLAASTNNRIDNIDYALTSKNLVVQSRTNGQPAQDAAFASNNEIAAPSPTRDGRMVQEFGYLEVPVELNYALVDRKLGVNIIGGVSSLFLIENSVSLESDGAATDIGEANNINSLNFSTNIGVGLNYDLSPKVKFHLEPMFKYQLNTFSDTSGSFQPFSVGVYSGLNFKF
ncbi:outer membrane beta-barrel protein [Muriicola sp. Z0-33]|uniref:outer membrane beta-barrel protein n=1 Tax=Muriicola sp. Z0-33 TaxID=2816957 RepID=UPI002238FF47|nr:outer membrane beta-barrel protein [Muriicola sp. Z0-33]MCW5514602.1 outer membrane beta-barrel protein [Muriicola sp. Z0-33]